MITTWTKIMAGKWKMNNSSTSHTITAHKVDQCGWQLIINGEETDANWRLLADAKQAAARFVREVRHDIDAARERVGLSGRWHMQKVGLYQLDTGSRDSEILAREIHDPAGWQLVINGEETEVKWTRLCDAKAAAFRFCKQHGIHLARKNVGLPLEEACREETPAEEPAQTVGGEPKVIAQPRHREKRPGVFRNGQNRRTFDTLVAECKAEEEEPTREELQAQLIYHTTQAAAIAAKLLELGQ